MGGAAPAQTQQVSKVELPAWVNQASEENYRLAKNISERPLQQFEGSTVATPSDMTTQAYGMLKSNLGTANPMFDQAGNLLTQAAGPLDVSKYLNPYTNEVEQRAIGNANISLDQQLRAVSDKSRQAGAFGGSRSAIESGVTRGEGIRGIGDLSASLRKAGFDTATSTALADRSGMLSTAGAMQGLGTARQASSLTDIQSLLGAGAQETGSRQALIDAAQKKFYEARDYPLEGLNTRLAALGMSPYGKTETSNKTATAEQLGPDWATIGLGALKTLPSLLAFSDRRAKTDIEKLGKLGDLDMYAYRYKSDPKTYPKVVGPMAQDIEKLRPKAVKKIGGKRVVDLNNLMEALA